ncbi:MAG: hypothetical protein HGA19_03000 [Oscillochloris sp.]|nr:hypothetical protein [Oscillochloris sp.]
MPTDKTAGLSQRRYITLVVRLLVGSGEDVQGTVVGLDEAPVGQFRRLDDLPGLLRDWLKAPAVARRTCDDHGDDGPR